MKRIACIVVAAVLSVCLAACGNTAVTPQVSAAEPSPAREYDVMRLKVARVYDGSFLGTGVGDRATPGELYFVPTSGAEFADGPLAAGMIVDVFYGGGIAESYPAELAEPFRIALTETRGDLVGLYLEVLEELYDEDEGLNGGITMLAFDFTEANNLMESEKAALAYLMCSEHGMEELTGTFEELCERGYIDREKLYFADGLLFELKTDAQGDAERFTFSVSKWRGGTGAVGMEECAAEYADGKWTYEPGGMWIS